MAVRVRGLRETVSAFRKYDRALGTELRNELKKAAEPVAASARSKVTRWQGASTKIAPRASGASVFVRQNARKVTGRRGDFGALQMRRAFIPALQENEEKVLSEVEDALDRFASSAGF